MKEKILKIIHGPDKLEPIYNLVFEYEKLVNNKEREDFLSVIKSLIIDGTDKEKFASLTVIKFLDKAKENEDIIKNTVEKIILKENKKLISPLLTLCADLSTSWAIAFILNTIKFFKPSSIEYSYYFDIGIRSLVSTEYWKEAIDEIKWALENFDNDYIIDFIAYFKWKRKKNDEDELFQSMNHNDFLVEKIHSMQLEIENRYATNYQKLSKNKL